MASAVATPATNGGTSAAPASSAASAAAVAKLSQPLSTGRKVWGRGDYADADASKWVVIYPHYIDKNRKRSEGRKIAAEKAVEKPNAGEIFECVRELGLRTQLELDKSYCRDCWVPGRIRVELVGENGSVLKPDVASNRPELYMKVAAVLPALRTKMQKQNPGKSGGGGGGGGGASSSGGGKGSSSTAGAKKKKKGKR